MKVPEIEVVCFVGAGTMGCFNALVAAVAGYRAVIYDISAEALALVPESLSGMADFLAADGFFSHDAIPDALARISTQSDLKTATAGVQLVSESVAERLEVKRNVHRELDAVCDAATLITTNTSKLLVSQIEDVLEHGDRFAALHSHLGSVLIDIVGGPRTSPQNIELLRRYVESLEAVPLVLKKEHPGYVLNALIGPLLTISDVLVIEGLATLEDVDRAWMQSQDASIGPFGLMDLFGLNIIHDGWSEPKPENLPLQEKVLSFLSPYIERGELGVKTGKGFYSYPEPQYQQENFVDASQDLSGIAQVLNCMLIAHAISLAHAAVAQPAEIDRAWTVSFKLAKGPFGTLEAMGDSAFLEAAQRYAAQGLFSAELLRIVSGYLSKGASA